MASRSPPNGTATAAAATTPADAPRPAAATAAETAPKGEPSKPPAAVPTASSPPSLAEALSAAGAHHDAIVAALGGAGRDDLGQADSPHIVNHSSHSQDLDLFSFLSAMHLSNGAGGSGSGGPGGGGGTGGGAGAITYTTASSGFSSVPATGLNPASPVQILASRKRKFLEQGGLGTSGKMTGLRPPFMRRSSDEDDQGDALHTPQCSQSGYADEEDHHHHAIETAMMANAAQQKKPSGSGGGGGGGGASGSGPSSSGHHHSNALVANLLHPHLMSEIDDNLAANFDDSLSGLGVDITSASYSMSEALMALPNLSISSSQIFKQEGGVLSHLQQQHHHHHQQQQHLSSQLHGQTQQQQQPKYKEESNSRESSVQQNFGALDLSNEEAHLPDSSPSHEMASTAEKIVRKTFIGSVSRENSRGESDCWAIAEKYQRNY